MKKNKLKKRKIEKKQRKTIASFFFPFLIFQMFPNHPMMMQTQQQVYQDPLATLAPVYTATYVQPGIH